MRKLGIYVHIPFCVRKCFYCDFLSFPAGEGERKRYLEGLLREIEREAPKYEGYVADSVFVGGGTPTVLSGKQIGRLLDEVRAGFAFGEKAEITVEMNPETADAEKLEGCLRAGVNRISIGAQSLRDEELDILGRVHSVGEFFRAYRLAREMGVENINVDVMAALPEQELEGYLDGLKRVMDLGPEHISAYSLIVEEGTPFYEWYGEKGERKDGRKALPSEEEERMMYERTGEVLEAGGYYRYEISNYAKKGYECRHNVGYWKRQDYVGFGLGAASMVGNVRWKNSSDMEKYMGRMESAVGEVKEDKHSLSVREQMEEFMFLGLRLTEGVGKEEFHRVFGKGIEEVYGEVIGKLCGQGLLMEGERIRLTPYGRDISNYVMAEFLFP